jgi:hypothetical protein
MSGWSGATPYLTSLYGVGRRLITSTSIPENPNACGLAEEEEEDFLSSIVHLVLCIRHLFTWGIRLLLQELLPLGDGQRQVLDSTCRTGRTQLLGHRETAAGRGGVGRQRSRFQCRHHWHHWRRQRRRRKKMRWRQRKKERRRRGSVARHHSRDENAQSFGDDVGRWMLNLHSDAALPAAPLPRAMIFARDSVRLDSFVTGKKSN